MRHPLLLALLLATAFTACRSKPAPPLDPGLRLSLQNCEELYEERLEDIPSRIHCQLSPGSEFTVLIEPTSARAATRARALLAIRYPDQTARVLEPPFGFESSWHHAFKLAAEGDVGEKRRIEALIWSGADPELPSDAAKASSTVAAWLDAQAATPGTGRIDASFDWQKALFDRLPAGSDAAACFQAYKDRRHDDAVIATCRRAWESRPVSEDRSEHVRMGNLLALALRLEGDYPGAAEVMQEVATQAGRDGVVRRQRYALHNLADIYTHLPNSLDRAMATLLKSEALATRIDDRFGLADTLRKQGQVLTHKGIYSDAQLKFHQAIELARSIGAEAIESNTLLYLGKVFAQLGDYANALRNFDAAEPTFRELDRQARAGDRSRWEDLGYFFGNLGVARDWALRRGERRDSLEAIEKECFEPALYYFGQLDRPEQIAEFTLRLADLHIVHGDPAGGRKLIDQAIPSVAARNSNPDYLRMAGQVALGDGRWQAARDAFLLLDAQGVLQPEFGWQAAFGLARAWRGLGDKKRADAELDRAMAAVETEARNTDMWIDRGWFIGLRQLVFRYAEELRLEAGDTEQAFAVAERSRVISAVATATQARITYLTSTQSEEFQKWKRELETLQDEMKPDEGEEVLAAVEREARAARRKSAREQLQARQIAFSRWVEQTAPIASPEPPTLAQVRDALQPDEAILAFSCEWDRLTAYVIGRDRFESRRLTLTAAELAEKVQKARVALLAGAPVVQDRELAGSLLAPLAGQYPRRLIVVPFGALYQLPFRALVVAVPPGATPAPADRSTPGSKAGSQVVSLEADQSLNEVTEVNYAPSVSLWWQRRKGKAAGTASVPAQTSRPSSILAVGDASRDLMSTAVEARAIATLFPNATPLIGDAATRAAVLRDLPAVDVFHFAGHGVVEGSSSMGPHLLLSEHQGLTGLDLLPRPLRARLVVLSGCETAGGDLMGGGDLNGLVSGFLGAGARAVVASFWPVQQGDALPLMRELYQGWLSQGLTPGEALRKASRAAASGTLGAQAAQARVWAGFALWGDGG